MRRRKNEMLLSQRTLGRVAVGCDANLEVMSRRAPYDDGPYPLADDLPQDAPWRERGRFQLTIEMPSIYASPPAAQRLRVRSLMHRIGQIFLLVEEGYNQDDFGN